MHKQNIIYWPAAATGNYQDHLLKSSSIIASFTDLFYQIDGNPIVRKVFEVH